MTCARCEVNSLHKACTTIWFRWVKHTCTHQNLNYKYTILTMFLYSWKVDMIITYPPHVVTDVWVKILNTHWLCVQRHLHIYIYIYIAYVYIRIIRIKHEYSIIRMLWYVCMYVCVHYQHNCSISNQAIKFSVFFAIIWCKMDKTDGYPGLAEMYKYKHR